MATQIPKCISLDTEQMNFFAETFDLSQNNFCGATFYRRNSTQCCVIFKTSGSQFTVVYHMDNNKFVIDQMEAF